MNIERLRELFDYDPKTGVLTRRVSRGRVRAGSVAGTLHHEGYLHVVVDRRRYLVHRIAFAMHHGEWPEQINHINGVRDDNRIANLERSSAKHNTRSLRRNKANTSGVTGVGWHKQARRWRAEIWVDGGYHYLGSFANKADAAAARKRAEREHGFDPLHGAPAEVRANRSIA